MLRAMSQSSDTTEAPQPPENDPLSVETLYAELYRDLKRAARTRLAGGGRNTLMDTSVLVHEAFLRMQRAEGLVLQDRAHFLAYAATTMRSVVVDFMRRRGAERRGAMADALTLDTEVSEQLGSSETEVLEVHEALDSLREIDPKLVQVVEMRYFAGMSELEIAKAMGVTDRTVRRYWERARLMLTDILRK